MKPKFIKEGFPWLMHCIKTPLNEHVYSYGIMFWQHKNVIQIHPDDILKELGKHSNTADFPFNKNIEIIHVCRVSEDFFIKRSKNVSKDWELHLYSAIQIVSPKEIYGV